MPRKSKLLLILFVMGLMQPLFAQQDMIKAYAGSAAKNYYCFYPSTLRMINLTGNPDYNQMVEGVEKLLVYILDSTAMADKSYLAVMDQYIKNGFEEYANIWGGQMDFSIYGREGKPNELTGIVKTETDLFAFYLIGSIDFAKTPSLIQNFKRSDMLNIFTLNAR